MKDRNPAANFEAASYFPRAVPRVTGVNGPEEIKRMPVHGNGLMTEPKGITSA